MGFYERMLKTNYYDPSQWMNPVVADASAPPLWARFYDIDTNQPIFCDRDGVAKRQLGEIGHERRNGYGWYGPWPAALLEKDYPAWKQKWGGSARK